VRGRGIVEEQVALRHVLAEVALHHTGVDEVFEEGGGSGSASGISNVPHVPVKLGIMK